MGDGRLEAVWDMALCLGGCQRVYLQDVIWREGVDTDVAVHEVRLGQLSYC